jgi:hypothetical protein
MSIIEANRKHIEAALAYSGGTHLFEDVEKAINEGNMQLWPASNSAAVTEIIQYARKKVLNVFLAGGDLQEIVGGLDAATEWAKSQGCDSMTLYGRKGWERVLDSHGFKPVMVVLERAI